MAEALTGEGAARVPRDRIKPLSPAPEGLQGARGGSSECPWNVPEGRADSPGPAWQREAPAPTPEGQGRENSTPRIPMPLGSVCREGAILCRVGRASPGPAAGRWNSPVPSPPPPPSRSPEVTPGSETSQALSAASAFGTHVFERRRRAAKCPIPVFTAELRQWGQGSGFKTASADVSLLPPRGWLPLPPPTHGDSKPARAPDNSERDAEVAGRKIRLEGSGLPWSCTVQEGKNSLLSPQLSLGPALFRNSCNWARIA